MTPERMLASLAAAVAFVAVVVGARALGRSGRIDTGNARRGALVALALAPIGVITGGLVVATADGGLGTGNGLGGGVVAVLAGLIGMTLGGLALSRARRSS